LPLGIQIIATLKVDRQVRGEGLSYGVPDDILEDLVHVDEEGWRVRRRFPFEVKRTALQDDPSECQSRPVPEIQAGPSHRDRIRRRPRRCDLEELVLETAEAVKQRQGETGKT